jgi:hypothetical protein
VSAGAGRAAAAAATVSGTGQCRSRKSDRRSCNACIKDRPNHDDSPQLSNDVLGLRGNAPEAGLLPPIHLAFILGRRVVLAKGLAPRLHAAVRKLSFLLL